VDVRAWPISFGELMQKRFPLDPQVLRKYYRAAAFNAYAICTDE
jgi:hypothetical protein